MSTHWGLRSVLTRRHVAATCHKCRCNTSRRQTTPCARSGDKLLQQLTAHFVAAASRRNSNQFEFVQLVVATNFVAATKIFTKILQRRICLQRRISRSDVLPRRRAATCCLVCTDLYFRKHRETCVCLAAG